MTKLHRFPNCISSVRYAAVVCPREFDIDYNETAFHWPHRSIYFQFTDASSRRLPDHCSTDYSTFIRKHVLVPYADIFCPIPCISLTWTNLISSRFVNNTTFEFYPCFERFGYNSHWWRFVSFPLFFHTEKEIYILLENCRKFLTTKGTREGISVYKNYLSKSLFLEISRKEERKVDPFVAFIESFLNASVNSRYNRRRKGPPYTNTRISTRVILIALCAHNG